MNLLQETLSMFEKCDKSLSDIRWIGGNDFVIPLGSFLELADKEYDVSQGIQVAWDLKIVFEDGSWLSRDHTWNEVCEWYDAGWRYNTPPAMPNMIDYSCRTLFGSYETLEEANVERCVWAF